MRLLRLEGTGEKLYQIKRKLNKGKDDQSYLRRRRLKKLGEAHCKFCFDFFRREPSKNII